MIKKIITLFKLGRKVAKSDILSITSKFKEPPLLIKILFKVLSLTGLNVFLLASTIVQSALASGLKITQPSGNKYAMLAVSAGSFTPDYVNDIDEKIAADEKLVSELMKKWAQADDEDRGGGDLPTGNRDCGSGHRFDRQTQRAIGIWLR